MSDDENSESIERTVAKIHGARDRPREQYREFSNYSGSHQSSIYGLLDEADRAQLWTEHFDHYRRDHPGLSAEQQSVLTQAQEILGSPSALGGEVSTEMHERLEHLKSQAIEVFGEEEARNLLAKLGA